MVVTIYFRRGGYTKTLQTWSVSYDIGLLTICLSSRVASEAKSIELKDSPFLLVRIVLYYYAECSFLNIFKKWHLVYVAHHFQTWCYCEKSGRFKCLCNTTF